LAKYYLKWWLELTKVPVEAEERVKGWLSMLEMVKADIKSGATKGWGISAGGEFAYVAKEAAKQKFTPLNFLI